MSKPADRHDQPRSPRLLLSSLVVACGLGIGPAVAFDAETGHNLARAWCSKCHLVEAGQSASDAAPTFQQIAGNADLTADRIRLWLADPHPRMPNLNLSRQEIESLVAYLESLRQP